MRNRGLLSWGVMSLAVLIAGYRGAQAQNSVQTDAANARATVAAAMPTQPPPTPIPAPTATAAPAAAPEKKEGAASELELLGIVRGATSAGALIGFDGKQEIFRKGDTVFDHGTLKDVREDSVVIHSGDNDVTLKVVKEAAPAPAEPAAEQVEAPAAVREAVPPPATEPVSRAEARAALKDFGTVLGKAEAKRVTVGGGHGVQLGKVDSSSFLAKLGLRSGDVLQKLNGIAIDDVDKLPDLSSAAEGRELNVSYSRNDIGLTVARPLQ
ncbi:MAG: type II secretion system protein N [Candidatus Binatia bacterium]